MGFLFLADRRQLQEMATRRRREDFRPGTVANQRSLALLYVAFTIYFRFERTLRCFAEFLLCSFAAMKSVTNALSAPPFGSWAFRRGIRFTRGGVLAESTRHQAGAETPFFTVASGGLLAIPAARFWLKRFLSKLGEAATGYTFHSLRRGACTAAFANGAQMDDLKALGG